MKVSETTLLVGWLNAVVTDPATIRSVTAVPGEWRSRAFGGLVTAVIRSGR